MTASEQRAVLTLCLMAAFADGGHDERERDEIRRVAEALGDGGVDVDAAAIYRQVLLDKPELPAVAAALTAADQRRFAYEMAVGICDADGSANERERAFLADLARVLGLDAGVAQSFRREADALAAAPLAGAGIAAATGGAAGPGPAAATGAAPSGPEGALVAAVPANAAEIDKMILNYAILNGALELLPQSLASMAIIPLQMKMVYRVGKAHGFDLDRGHVKDLLATLGVGMTSQYVEQFGRKLLGGLLGSIGGGLLRGAGRLATGAAFSFASTYALGHVAKRYYAGGRRIDAAGLQQAFREMLGEAKALQGNYAGQIAEQARTLDLDKVLDMVRK